MDITLTRDHNITTGKIYQARGARGAAAAVARRCRPFCFKGFHTALAPRRRP